MPRKPLPRAAPSGNHVGRVPPEPKLRTPPRQRAAGGVPNPRKPQLVRDVHGNGIGDLFLMFPDLPRPSRPSARLPIKRGVRRPGAPPRPR